MKQTVLQVLRQQIDILDKNILRCIEYYSFLQQIWKQEYIDEFTSQRSFPHSIYIDLLKICEDSLVKAIELPGDDRDLIADKTGLQDQLERCVTLFVTALEERFVLVRTIGEYKKRYDLPAFIPERWQEVLQQVKLAAQERHLDVNKIEACYTIIHKHAIVLEEN